MAELSDAELLSRFRAGQPTALDQLFERHETRLYCLLLGMLHDPHQAEDALQETFVRALEHLDGVDPEHLHGWLSTVAYHQALLMKRRQVGQLKHIRPAIEQPDKPDSIPGPLDSLAREDEARRLRDLLEQLPAAQREVIHQRVYEGKKFREIADTLGCTLNTALTRMHEGLKRLRLLWGESHV